MSLSTQEWHALTEDEREMVRQLADLLPPKSLTAKVDLELLARHIARLRTALATLSTHDFSSVAGCRRGQTIAARALRGEDADELSDEARSTARAEARRKRK